MARNLYILAGTLFFFALAAWGLTYTSVVTSKGDIALWHTMSLGLLFVALLVALGGTLTNLFEQAENRTNDARRRRK